MSRTDSADTFKLTSYLAFENAGNLLSGRYEITDTNGVIKEAEFDFSVDPLSETMITVPELSDGNYIRFIFTLKTDTLWEKKGYEVCFDQLELKPVESLAPASCTETEAFSENLEILEDSPLKLIIKASAVTYTFNKRIGFIDSVKYKDSELLDAPMKFNFFRAPVDNDSMRGEWFRSHMNDYDTKVHTLEILYPHTVIPGDEKGNVSDIGAVLKIGIEQAFGWNMYAPFITVNTIYTFEPSGRLTLSCKARTSNKVTLLPRFGIRLFVPKTFHAAEYFGYGPYESYTDKHNASYIGKFTSEINDMFEDYIKPQENSSHFGCKYMKLLGKDFDVLFTNSQTLSFNASEYTQEELSKAKHRWELTKSDSNIICVDYRMAGVGSNSCGPALAEKYRIPLPEFSADLCILPIAK